MVSVSIDSLDSAGGLSILDTLEYAGITIPTSAIDRTYYSGLQ